MFRNLLLLSLLFLTTALTAQTRVAVGLAVGQESYESRADDPRVLTGGDVLLRRGAWGGHLAVEYADLTEESALIAIHANVIYRQPFGAGFFLLVGGGPTFVSIGSPNT